MAVEGEDEVEGEVELKGRVVPKKPPPSNVVVRSAPVRVRALVDRLASAEGGAALSLEREWHELNKSCWRFRRSFRDCLEDREEGKVAYGGVLVWDRTRLKLLNSASNFINASLLRSWDQQPGAYILTQIPKEENIVDFYQMLWQTIASTAAVLLPAASFAPHLWNRKIWWPTEPGPPAVYGRFRLTCEEVVRNLDWTSYFLTLDGPGQGGRREKRVLRLLHYQLWRQDLEPPPELPLLLARLHLLAESGNRKNGIRTSPLVLVCPTGVARCGLTAALDMCMGKLFATYTIDIAGIVQQVRWERYGTLSKAWEYVFLHARLFDLVFTNDIVPHKDRLLLAKRLFSSAPDFLHLPSDPALQGPKITPFY